MEFAGIACPSMGTTLGLAGSLAHVTEQLRRFWSAVQPIYTVHPVELARWGAHVAEGLGRAPRAGPRRQPRRRHDTPRGSHGPSPRRRAGLRRGAPGPARELGAGRTGTRGTAPARRGRTARDLPGDPAGPHCYGWPPRWPTAPWANAALSSVPRSSHGCPPRPRRVLPGQHGPDRDRRGPARGGRRRPADDGHYLRLPNYRAYWRAAGYPEEIDALEAALAARDRTVPPRRCTTAGCGT